MPNKPKALYVLGKGAFERIYGPDTQAEIAELVDVIAPAQTPAVESEAPELLSDVEILFSGWGGPKIHESFLRAAPRLKALFYGAGATGGMVSAAGFERGLIVTSAAYANAIPVAEYTVAMTTLALKQVFRLQRDIQRAGAYVRLAAPDAVTGGYGATIGLISLGTIGLHVIYRLRAALPDVRVVAHDPFVDPAVANRLDIDLVGLDDLFARADVVSLHTPWLPETERMIGGRHFEAMKPNATFVNTARGAVVAEDEMIAALRARPDLTALLDVTYPEPPEPGSPLYTLPNVFLTPHIAGSVGEECRRMGRYMLEELKRYLADEPLRYQIRPEAATHTSHRVV